MPKRSGFRMKGGSLTCPPGFYCMDFSTVIFAILIVLIVVGALVYILKPFSAENAVAAPPMNLNNYAPVEHIVHKEKDHKKNPPTVIVVQAPPSQANPVNSDPRFAPLSPEQSYGTQPDIRGFPSPPVAAGLGPTMPINIQTRGYSDTYQQVGLLTTAGGSDTSASPTRTILPLFGRKLITNRDRWNYYTRTDGINPVQVPIQYKRRNCDEDIGCDEIMEGDSVGVPVLGQSFTANIYRYSTPRYLPMV